MFLSLITLIACRAEMPAETNDIVGHDPEHGEADVVIMDDAPESDTGDSAEDTESEEVDPCTFVIEGDDHNEYTVTTKLELSLNPESASGVIAAGSDEIITVDATAVCGDVVMTGVYFYFSGSDYADTDWIGEINDVVSGVSYDYDGHGTFEGFGMYSTRPVSYYDTQGPERAVWPVTFTEPIVIPKGTTFTYNLSIRMGGDDGLNPSSDDFFFANTTNFVSWYGTDNPSLYPETEIMPTAIGGVELQLK